MVLGISGGLDSTLALLVCVKTFDKLKLDRKGIVGVTLTIEDGEFVFLVGPSGSGKSTIIKLLTGEVEPCAGRIMINGFSVSNISCVK